MCTPTPSLSFATISLLTFSCSYADQIIPPRFSALKDVHGNDKNDLGPDAVSHHLGDELAANNITDVFVCGTAGDYCASQTAIDVAVSGLKSYLIEDVTMSIDLEKGWPDMKKDLLANGVKLVTMDGPEIGALREVVGTVDGQGKEATQVLHGILG